MPSENNSWECLSSQSSENESMTMARENSGLIGDQGLRLTKTIMASRSLKIEANQNVITYPINDAPPTTIQSQKQIDDSKEKQLHHLELSNSPLADPLVKSKNMRRAEQNRQAQKAYRKRKEAYVKSLESEQRIQKLLRLRLNEDIHNAAQLKQEIIALRQENEWLRKMIEDLEYRNNALMGADDSIISPYYAMIAGFDQIQMPPSVLLSQLPPPLPLSSVLPSSVLPLSHQQPTDSSPSMPAYSMSQQQPLSQPYSAFIQSYIPGPYRPSLHNATGAAPILVPEMPIHPQ